MFLRFVRIGLWALVAVVSIGYLGYRFIGPLLQSAQEDSAQTQSIDVGGPFQLTTHLGESVTDADFQGKYRLMFFGYTYCPDICPFELATMTQALDLLEEEGVRLDKLQPLFISIDPERDSVDALKDYMAAFHPKFIGLTGSVEQVDAVTQAYSIYAQKAEVEGASDYLMNHSSLVYLMGPNGEFIRYFPPGRAPEEMAAGLKKALGHG